MESLVAGAALGAVYTEVQNVIIQGQSRNEKFKEYLDRLKRAVESLAPRVEEAKYLDERLANGRQVDMNSLARQMETIKLSKKLEEAMELVVKCSTLPDWNIWKRDKYCKRLEKMENDLLWFLQVHTQTVIWADVKMALQQIMCIRKNIPAIRRTPKFRIRLSVARFQEAVTPAAGDGEKRESGASEGGGTPAAEQQGPSLSELRDRVAFLERAIQEKRWELSRRAQQLDHLLNDDDGSSTTGSGRCLLKLSPRHVKKATDSFRRTIGKGGSADIYEGRLYGTKVAIKRIRTSRWKEAFEREVQEFMTGGWE